MLEEANRDYATAMADRANRLMAQHDIAPTPDNFAVWFSYAQGAQGELKQAIDALIAEGRGFDASVCRRLQAILLSGTPAAVARDVPGQLATAIAEARRYVAAAIADNREQIEVIGNVVEKAESGVDPVTLVRCLLTELTRAATRTTELERSLTDTSRELDSIRDSLQQAERRARTDMLTGLSNRHSIEESLQAAQQAATDAGEPLSMLMVDIDLFRKFNDSYGYAVGDQVLRLLAGVLKDHLRASDVPGRYGGEELIALLPQATLADCESIGERLRRSFADNRIKRRSTGELLPEVTVSVGAARFRPGETPEQLVDRCNNALLLAKRIGRNRVVTEERLEGRRVA